MTPTGSPSIFSKSAAVQLGGILPYKWEAYCSTNGRRIAGFAFLRSFEARKIRRHKWGVYCRTNWRCIAVLEGPKDVFFTPQLRKRNKLMASNSASKTDLLKWNEWAKLGFCIVNNNEPDTCRNKSSCETKTPCIEMGIISTIAMLERLSYAIYSFLLPIYKFSILGNMQFWAGQVGQESKHLLIN